MMNATRSPIESSEQVSSVVEVPVTMHWLWAPFGLLLALPLPVLVSSFLIPDDSFPALFAEPSFLDERTRLVAISYAGILLIFFAFVVPMRRRSTVSIVVDARGRAWIHRATVVLATVTFAAYAVWIGNAMVRGLGINEVASLLSGETGAVFALRDKYFENLGGVTTWMQLGALVAPLAVLRSKAGGRPAGKLLFALFAAGFVRALLNSERLALIEIALSTLLASLILRPQAPRAVRTVGRAVMFVLCGWVALIVLFAAFEYFRSWTYAKNSSDDGFWQYTITLLLGYYATALNLAGFDATILKGDQVPAALFQGNLYEQLFGPSPLSGTQRAYGLQTFTNRSGLLVPEVALGVMGGAAVMLLFALAIATMARRTAQGHVVAFVTYCASAVSVLEVVRIFYFGSSRFLPVILAATAMAVSWSLMRSKAQRETPEALRRRRLRSGRQAFPT